jgi:hypothetical protein
MFYTTTREVTVIRRIVTHLALHERQQLVRCAKAQTGVVPGQVDIGNDICTRNSSTRAWHHAQLANQ